MKKLKADLLANYVSLAVLGASGMIINFVITTGSSLDALGIFNQAFAVYIVCSQLAVGGVHLSLLREVASTQDRAERAKHITACMGVVLLLSLIVAAILAIIRPYIGQLLRSDQVASALLFVIPALVLFAQNKVLLASLNGADCMVSYAFLQSLRYIILLIVLISVIGLKAPYWQLTSSLLAAELGVFVVAFLLVKRSVGIAGIDGMIACAKGHISFGLRAFLSGVFLELNTRVDILILGAFLSDSKVGVYTLAATFYEGLIQALVVVRSVVTPKLAPLVTAAKIPELFRFMQESRKYLYPGAALSVILVAGVLYAVSILIPAMGISGEVIECFLLLSIGVLVASGFVPFENLLILAGAPGWYTAYTLSVLAANVFGNLILVPQFGTYGAAIATSLSLCLSVFILTGMLWSRLKLKPASIG